MLICILYAGEGSWHFTDFLLHTTQIDYHSAASNLTEAEVDERMQTLIDMEDPGTVVDLCHLNCGAESKYDAFWAECDQ